MIKTNFHTHTVFCDGKDTPREIVKTAISKGFTAIGFSGHSFCEPDKDFAMNSEDTANYKKEIALLKEEYKGKINILCGIEQDLFSDESTDGYDYVIGSVHYVLKGGEYLPVDKSAEDTKRAYTEFYGGDFDSLAEDYFANVVKCIKKFKPQIIGHFDLISKYSEQNSIIQSERFLNAAEKAVKEIIHFKIPFEINTGAMARGVRKVPYPTQEILCIINRYGGDIIFSSDCHNREYLDYAFDKAYILAKKCGFTRQAVITEKGIEYIDL